MNVSGEMASTKGTPTRGAFEVVFVPHLKGQLQRPLHLEDHAAEEPYHALLASSTTGNPSVNRHHDEQARHGIRGVHSKHQHHAQHRPHQADAPVRLERRTVTRIRRHVLQKRHQANGAVGHHEEHGNDLRHRVDVSHQHEHERNEARRHRRADRLLFCSTPLLQPIRHARGENAICSNGLQRPRGDHHRPQGGAHGRRRKATGMIGPHRAMFSMNNSSDAKASSGADHHSLIATAM